MMGPCRFALRPTCQRDDGAEAIADADKQAMPIHRRTYKGGAKAGCQTDQETPCAAALLQDSPGEA